MIRSPTSRRWCRWPPWALSSSPVRRGRSARWPIWSPPPARGRRRSPSARWGWAPPSISWPRPSRPWPVRLTHVPYRGTPDLDPWRCARGRSTWWWTDMGRHAWPDPRRAWCGDRAVHRGRFLRPAGGADGGGSGHPRLRPGHLVHHRLPAGVAPAAIARVYARPRAPLWSGRNCARGRLTSALLPSAPRPRRRRR